PRRLDRRHRRGGSGPRLHQLALASRQCADEGERGRPRGPARAGEDGAARDHRRRVRADSDGSFPRTARRSVDGTGIRLAHSRSEWVPKALCFWHSFHRLIVLDTLSVSVQPGARWSRGNITVAVASGEGGESWQVATNRRRWAERLSAFFFE